MKSQIHREKMTLSYSWLHMQLAPLACSADCLSSTLQRNRTKVTPPTSSCCQKQNLRMLRRRVFRFNSCSIPVSTSNRHKSDSINESSSQYCLDLVKKFDYEGFVSALLVPQAPQRTTVIALRAFNIEVCIVYFV